MRGSSSPFRYRCREVFFLVAVLLFSGLASRAAEAPEETPSGKISYIYPRWQEANDFKRISEYFTGNENTGGDIILRSDKEVRQGLYFRIGMSWGTTVPVNSKVTLEYIRGDNPQVHTKQFDLPEMPSSPFAEIRLGLTGKDWESKKRALVAWRITLRDGDGKLVAQSQSYLWGMPRDKVAKEEASSSVPGKNTDSSPAPSSDVQPQEEKNNSAASH